TYLRAVARLNDAAQRAQLPFFVDAAREGTSGHAYRIESVRRVHVGDATYRALELRSVSAAEEPDPLGTTTGDDVHALILLDAVEAYWRHLIRPALVGSRELHGTGRIYTEHSRMLRNDV